MPRGRFAGSSSPALSRSAGGTVGRLVVGGEPSTARALAARITVSPPGTSRTRRLTCTTAWIAEQSHITNSAPLAAASSAALAAPEPASRASDEPCSGCCSCPGRCPDPSASTGVRTASAAMSAAVCAAARALTRAATSTATTPVIRMSPDSANPTSVAPPCSAAAHPDEPARAALARAGRAALTAGALNGRPGPAVGQAHGPRPPWP
jgi:hypothetical protein